MPRLDYLTDRIRPHVLLQVSMERRLEEVFPYFLIGLPKTLVTARRVIMKDLHNLASESVPFWNVSRTSIAIEALPHYLKRLPIRTNAPLLLFPPAG